jgi:hypothetical protein
MDWDRNRILAFQGGRRSPEEPSGLRGVKTDLDSFLKD